MQCEFVPADSEQMHGDGVPAAAGPGQHAAQPAGGDGQPVPGTAVLCSCVNGRPGLRSPLYKLSRSRRQL